MSATVTLVHTSGNAYHKHEKVVQSLAGLDIERREETGPVGFIHSPSPTELIISPHQALDPAYAEGKPIGLLGLGFSSRRRNRMNGTIQKVANGSMHIQVEESFGNCPKYIQARHLVIPETIDAATAAAASGGPATSGRGALEPEQATLVSGASTFFVASYHEAEADDDARLKVGCDVSHRGGAPGFVHIDAPGDALRWPDYMGNNFFQTLGNIHSNHQASLLFIDFQNGDTLQITGTADLDTSDKSLPGAERTINFRTDEWVHKRRALPLTTVGPVEMSPYNPRAGGESSASRAFVTCTAVEDAARGVKTFRFAAPQAVGSPDPPFQYIAGQFSSFDVLDPSGSGSVINRTWTISSHPDERSDAAAFSITVKKLQNGVVSPWLHASFRKGGVLEWRGVGGEFVTQAHSGPALLIAAGIGITPMRTMLLEFLKQGRQAMLLYSTRTASEAAFLDELRGLEEKHPSLFRLVVTLTGQDESWAGRKGRIDKSLMAEQISDAKTMGVYICGPEPFMAAISDVAGQLGVPTQQIFMESFAF